MNPPSVKSLSRTAGRPLRVGVVGSGYWLRVLSELMRRAGIDHEAVDWVRRSDKVRWVLKRGWRRFDVIQLMGGMDWRLGTVLGLAGAPAIIHWLGSDVMHLRASAQRGWRGRLHWRCAHQWTMAHMADSSLLVEELRQMGIEASVVRLLPTRIEAAVEPLPPRPTVLSYWFDGLDRRNFYGGPIVFQLAREFPNLEFRILEATGKDEEAMPNVRFLGHRDDPTQYYREATVLIRIPEHDSVSAMVLEMLARGRYVIYNKRVEGCHFASNLDEARAALSDIVTRTEPNSVGAEMVRRDFSLEAEVRALGEFYARLGH
jgi:hypothetical protein